MQEKQLNVELRSKTGKGISRQLRMMDMIPGVVYGKGMDPMAVTIKNRELKTAISGEGGQNSLLTLVGGGSLDKATVIIVDLQRDAIKGTYRHVDLHRVNMTEKLRVTVPIVLIGTSKGVKEGGLLDQVRHELHVECLPGNIPDHIEIDVTDLEVAHSIHVNEITVPNGVTILDDPAVPVVSVLGRAVEEAPTEEA